MSSSITRLLTLSALFMSCADISGGSSTDATEKIIGGQAESGVPQAVRIMYGSNTNCTGTLIAAKVVLTAAHCIQYDGPVLNNTHIDIVIDGRVVESVNIVGHIMHSDWQITASSPEPDLYAGSDIALLYLEQAVSSTGPLGIDRMPPNQYLSTTGKIVGFGRTNSQEFSSAGTKNSLVVSISGYEELNPNQNKTRKNTYTLRSTDDVRRSACMGDSGGPLIKNGVAGVSSYVDAGGGDACLNRSFYTSVYPHLDWINMNLIEPRLGRLSLQSDPIESLGNTGGGQTPPAPGQDGGSGGQAGTGSASCEQTMVCIVNCESDSCKRSCVERASQTALNQINELELCGQQMSCQDFNCIVTYCPAQFSACFPNGIEGLDNADGSGGTENMDATQEGGSAQGERGCLSYVSCLNTCQSQSCYDQCWERASARAVDLYIDYSDCAESYCQDASPEECAYDICSYEWDACLEDL